MRSISLASLVLTTAIVAQSATAQAVSPNIERGFDPEKAYAVSADDVINVFNGNLNVPIPLGQPYPVGGNFSYQFALHYGGNSWEIHSQQQFEDRNSDGELELETYVWGAPSRRDNAGFGWRLTFGRLFLPNDTGCQVTAADPALKWAYESPDGGVHCFHRTLHDGEVFAEGRYYSRDGSYLRLETGSGSLMTVEFPDGTSRDFDTNSTHASKGRTTRIYDKSGNEVAIDYNASGYPAIAGLTPSKVWKVSDSRTRVHWVYFKTTAEYHEVDFGGAVAHESVAAVSLRAFDPAAAATGGATATYKLLYAGEATTSWATLPRPCVEGLSHPNLGLTTKATLLSTIELPESLKYQFTYDLDGTNVSGGACYTSGTLESMTLPTGAQILWKYADNTFPANSFVGDKPEYRGHGTNSAGVTERKVLMGTAQVARRTYDWEGDNITIVNPPPRERRVIVTDYGSDGANPPQFTTILKKSKHFFSICVDSCSSNGSVRGEYGLPLTRKSNTEVVNPFGGHHLSTIEYGPDSSWSQILRKTYVKYEGDKDLSLTGVELDVNRRMQSSRVVHTDGKYTETSSSDFDGLGHYRKVTTDGDVGGTTTRSVTTNYNPDGQPGTDAAWLLETFSDIQTSEKDRPPGTNEASARTDFCFDAASGLLLRKRTFRGDTAGRADLLAKYTYTAGNLVKEEYFGGGDPAATDDTLWLPADFDTCDGTPTTATYTINHTYQYGVRRDSAYAGQTFKILDVDVDRTGLVKISRDTAGVATTYTYDLLGRLTSVTPTAVVPLTYSYTAPTTGDGPGVSMKRMYPNDSTSRAEGRYYYDRLGRLVQSSVTAAAPNKWNSTWQSYDALGQQTVSSVALERSSGDREAMPAGTDRTSREYDPLGRLTKEIRPDSQSTSIAYTGAAHLNRTVGIVTALNSPPADVTTRETYDQHGRLIAVIEDYGVGSSYANLKTEYEYDIGNRLSKVLAGSQSRTFEYDDAGLLTSESHPELNGESIDYPRYDSRGHSLRQEYSSDCLLERRFTYDAAERLQNVWMRRLGEVCASGLFDSLKEFTYGTADGAKGKLSLSRRYNRFTDADYVVEQTLTYGDTAKRLTGVATKIKKDSATLQEFNQTYTYNDLNLPETFTYPTCATCTGANQTGLKNCYTTGFLTRVVPAAGTCAASTPDSAFASSIAYHPSGAVASIERPNSVTDSRAADPDGMGRPRAFTISGWDDACTQPAISPEPSDRAVEPGTTTSISVPAISGAQYQWYTGVSGNTSSPIAGATNSVYITPPITAESKYWVRVWNACGLRESRTVTVTVSCTPLNTPGGLAASATSTTAVSLSWNASAGAHHYEIERIENGTATVFATPDQATAFLDSGRAQNKTYVYRVRAVSASGGCQSAYGSRDLATTISWHSITGRISSLHINQLRDGVNAMRVANGWQPLAWSAILPSGTPAPAPGVRVYGLHITSLRSRMDEAFAAALGFSSPSYTTPAPLQRKRIRAMDFTELQERAR